MVGGRYFQILDTATVLFFVGSFSERGFRLGRECIWSYYTKWNPALIDEMSSDL